MRKFLLILAASAAGHSAFADGMPDAQPRVKVGTTTSIKVKPKDGEAAKPYDSSAVDWSISAKQTNPKQIVLPGVMTFAGESPFTLDPSRAQQISMTNGGSRTVFLSRSEPNRIQLPFTNPYIISDDRLEIKKHANNVYVSFNFNGLPEKAVQIFLEPADGGVVLGLQLVPKEIASQTIIVADDTAAANAARQKLANQTSEIIQSIQSTLELVTRGGVPDGYSVVAVHVPPIYMDGLIVEVGRRLSSREHDIYDYVVQNPTSAEILVREEQFDGDLTEGVTIFPQPLLKPGAKSRVIVMAKKQEAR